MKKSVFDGSLLNLVGWIILGVLVTIFTLGIAFPWAVCKVYGWYVNHTILEGRRLKFKGTAMGLFGNWMKWWFLSVITLGIYSFWVFISLSKWIVKNTIFEDEEENKEREVSYFEGGLLTYVGRTLLIALAGIILNGILMPILIYILGGDILGAIILTEFIIWGIIYPWGTCYILEWFISNTVIGGKRLKFEGTAMSLLKKWIKWWLLCLITLGIYSFWVFLSFTKWVVEHTIFNESSGEYILSEDDKPIEKKKLWTVIIIILGVLLLLSGIRKFYIEHAVFENTTIVSNNQSLVVGTTPTPPTVPDTTVVTSQAQVAPEPVKVDFQQEVETPEDQPTEEKKITQPKVENKSEVATTKPKVVKQEPKVKKVEKIEKDLISGIISERIPQSTNVLYYESGRVKVLTFGEISYNFPDRTILDENFMNKVQNSYLANQSVLQMIIDGVIAEDANKNKTAEEIDKIKEVESIINKKLNNL